MGLNLADLVTSEPRTLEDFSGKILAIDAFNTLYQFLAIIRQPDGTPLMDRQGRVTSHLSGLIYRLSPLPFRALLDLPAGPERAGRSRNARNGSGERPWRSETSRPPGRK